MCDMHLTRRGANEKYKERKRDERDDARDTNFKKVSKNIKSEEGDKKRAKETGGNEEMK